MKLSKTIVFTLVILSLISCVSAANITYSEEYYSLGQKADINVDYILKLIDQMSNRNNMYDSKLQLSIFYELRRQTILMEKQNALIAEQTEMMNNRTLVCTHPGYAQCLEYSWR